MKVLENVYSYAVVIQFTEEGKSADYYAADIVVNSRYYPDDFWTWFMNEGMEFAKYDATKKDTRQFFYRPISESTQGHILYLYKKEYKNFQTVLRTLKDRFSA